MFGKKTVPRRVFIVGGLGVLAATPAIADEIQALEGEPAPEILADDFMDDDTAMADDFLNGNSGMVTLEDGEEEPTLPEPIMDRDNIDTLIEEYELIDDMASENVDETVVEEVEAASWELAEELGIEIEPIDVEEVL